MYRTQLTIRVKKRDRIGIAAISTSIHSASPLTPASLMSTPIDSPATRQSTDTPALETDQGRDYTVEQVNMSNESAPTRKEQTSAANEVAIETPGIFTSYTKQSESFHVFPHKGSAKLVASINVSLRNLFCPMEIDRTVFRRPGRQQHRARKLHHRRSSLCSSSPTSSEHTRNHRRNLDRSFARYWICTEY
jgi:hypothetical protein